MPGEGLFLMLMGLIGAGFAVLFSVAITVSGYARNSAIAGVIFVVLGALFYAGTMPWNSDHEWANNFRGVAITVCLTGSGFIIGTSFGILIRMLKSRK